MKTLIFNKNSWHYWLAREWANFSPYDEEEQNICAYTKYVLAGLGKILFISALMVAAFVIPAINLIYCIVIWEFNVIAIATIAMIIFIASSITVSICVGYIRDGKFYIAYKKKPDGFIKLAYKSWKDKFCCKIEFEEQNVEAEK